MRDIAPLRVAGLLLMTLLAIAFATATVARAAPSVSEVRLEAYQLSGGLLSDLCNDKGPDHAHMASCALCNLIASADVPGTVPPLVRVDRAIVAAVILPRMQGARLQARDPATPTRGPPRAPERI